jgi:two-component system phosphate regulon sensor histidine kinase PhoR
MEVPCSRVIGRGAQNRYPLSRQVGIHYLQDGSRGLRDARRGPPAAALVSARRARGTRTDVDTADTNMPAGPGVELGERGIRRLIDPLVEGVVTIDRELRVVFANPPAAELLGIDPAADLQPLPDPWPGQGLREIVRSLFEPGTTADKLVETPSGTYEIHCLSTDGSRAAMLIFVDVTQRERRERRQHAEQEFIANAAHELRTPLTAITGAIEVLQAGAKHEERERDLFLGHIERECARLRRLVRALLTLVRAQALEEDPRLEVVPLCALLHEVGDGLQPAAGVEVAVECRKDLATLANLELVEQAVGALASNASDYTTAGRITLSARLEGDGTVVIEVADTGPGMAPDVVRRAGERFLTGATGFGLGISIVYDVAEALGGSLEFDTQAGKGTTARLTLKAARLTRT